MKELDITHMTNKWISGGNYCEQDVTDLRDEISLLRAETNHLKSTNIELRTEIKTLEMMWKDSIDRNVMVRKELKEMYEKYEPVCWEEPGETSPALIANEVASAIRHCEFCKFYEPVKYTEGKCKYNPPEINPNMQYGAFPVVESNNWCGKFELLGKPPKGER